MHVHSIRRVLLLALGTTALAVGTASAATAPAVEIGTPTLLAKGAAVAVPVTVTCDSGFGSVGLNLIQRAGNRTAAGSGQTSLTCDGAAHTYTLGLVTFGGVFKQGLAALGGYAEVCDEVDCASTRIEPREVRITR